MSEQKSNYIVWIFLACMALSFAGGFYLNRPKEVIQSPDYEAMYKAIRSNNIHQDSIITIHDTIIQIKYEIIYKNNLQAQRDTSFIHALPLDSGVQLLRANINRHR